MKLKTNIRIPKLDFKIKATTLPLDTGGRVGFWVAAADIPDPQDE